MISLEEFHQYFLQLILSDAESRGLMRPQSFFENVCEELISSGDLTNNYTVAEYSKTGMEIHGYDYDDERKILSLLVHQFFQDEEIQTLTKNQIDTKFKRLRNFYAKCAGGFYQNLEETLECYSMAYNIYQWNENNQIDGIKLVVLTDGKATRNLKELPDETMGNKKIQYRVIDIEYLHKIHLSENSGGDFEVDVNLPSIQIESDTDEYSSYLSHMPGDSLVAIYEKYGQKLFEQNVRTFLQFRGNVNKGLRNTIEYNPEMFFAYNNGITATATDVELGNSGNIIKMKNFQIVNGGQTTSAIYAANKNSKLDVSKVSVQMKLSVVKDKDKQSDFVSKVSEYANTQNKINKSDFFSNSPFHKEFKSYSKRVWVAASQGSQLRTHWFYERVRGEYLNEQAYLTPAKKKQFSLENPKYQLLDKTFLSKSENAWLQKPNIVSRGAQYSFAAFAEDVTKQLEKNKLVITEAYFKDSISRVILFKQVEKMISSSDWYSGGFRAQTVAYSISLLSFLIAKEKKFLNFSLIWDAQALPKELFEVLSEITQVVYEELTNPPEGYANVAQWCKQEKCWDSIKKLSPNIAISNDLLINKEEKYSRTREDKKEKVLDNGIEIQTFVISLPMSQWKMLYDYIKVEDSSTFMQKDILNKFTSGRLSLPSEKQSKILYQLYNKALSEGVVFAS